MSETFILSLNDVIATRFYTPMEEGDGAHVEVSWVSRPKIKCHLVPKKRKRKEKDYPRDGGHVSNVPIISAIWRTMLVHPPFSAHLHAKRTHHWSPTLYQQPPQTWGVYKSPVLELRSKLLLPAEKTRSYNFCPLLSLDLKSFRSKFLFFVMQKRREKKLMGWYFPWLKRFMCIKKTIMQGNVIRFV